MKCKCCSYSHLTDCPICGGKVVMCNEGDIDVIDGKNWNKDFGCNGIYEGRSTKEECEKCEVEECYGRDMEK